ncbi:MAG: GntR family transcriptional regulator [Sphaerochaeta sp.]|jgi:DNA-binding GntR family transcriptional regulator|uniref:GntR family transcriptional regulator n=1 Tax=Sphaerochaeta sp. TaxID=1972642 RepID=UPI002FCB5DA3
MESLKSSAYVAIKSKIADCTYAPGSMVNEEILRQSLNISRTPIRDALGRLEQEGLIVIKPKKGILISPLTFDEISQIFEIRMVFEPYALLNYGNRLDETFLLNQYRICLTEPGSATESFGHDDRLHAQIVQATQNHYIEESYNTISVQNQRLRRLTGVKHERLRSTYDEHKEIITACLKKNWKEAADAMRHHLIQSKDSALSIVLETNPQFIVN